MKKPAILKLGVRDPSIMKTTSSENTKPESEASRLIRAALQEAAKRYREQHAEENAKPESETDRMIREALQAAEKRYREQHAEENKRSIADGVAKNQRTDEMVKLPPLHT